MIQIKKNLVIFRKKVNQKNPGLWMNQDYNQSLNKIKLHKRNK